LPKNAIRLCIMSLSIKSFCVTVRLDSFALGWYGL
jgi:hypothetical protein